MVEAHCSNFRIITAIFRVSEHLGNLWYPRVNIACELISVFLCVHPDLDVDDFDGSQEGKSHVSHVITTPCDLIMSSSHEGWFLFV